MAIERLEDQCDKDVDQQRMEISQAFVESKVCCRIGNNPMMI